MSEYKMCPVCGGISREGAYPRLMQGLCTCPEKPAPVAKIEPDIKYGDLGNGVIVIHDDSWGQDTFNICTKGEIVIALSPQQFLKALDWGQKCREAIERLAKGHGT